MHWSSSQLVCEYGQDKHPNCKEVAYPAHDALFLHAALQTFELNRPALLICGSKMEGLGQQSGERSEAIMSRLDEAKIKGMNACLIVENEIDETQWQVLAPAADDVTQGYVSAHKCVKGIVTAQALHKANSPDAATRGNLYPFVMGEFKTNSLLFMADWLAAQHAARLVRLNVIQWEDAKNLVSPQTSAWHLFNANFLLSKWTGMNASAYDNALRAAASAKHSKHEKFYLACQKLAYAAFILACPELPSPPTSTMANKLWAILAENSTGDTELARLFPAVIDKELVNQARECRCLQPTELIWEKIDAICKLIQAPETLRFVL